MKSYIQGLITGGVFVFAIMVLMGADARFMGGKYQISTSMMSGNKNPHIYETIINTQNGKVKSRMKILAMDYRYE